jgi:hypothetical protein
MLAGKLRGGFGRHFPSSPLFAWNRTNSRTTQENNYLKGRDGDRINGVVAAAGYNFSLLLRWLTALLRAVIAALFQTTAILHDDSLEASRPIMPG